MATPNGFESIENVTRVGNTLKMDSMSSNNQSVFLDHQMKIENTNSKEPSKEEDNVDNVSEGEETINVRVPEVSAEDDPKIM